MGQSFLTHDEKSTTGSPSPDLLQFNGAGPKFFGSLSSVREASTSGASSTSRSTYEEAVSELSAEGSTASSPRSPISLPPPPGEEEEDDGVGSSVDDHNNSQGNNSFSSLVPTPIQPGNVSRLREKFMDCGRTESGKLQIPERNVNFNNENVRNREVVSAVDFTTTNSNPGRRIIRGGTLPPTTSLSSPRNRSSLYNLNPASYHHRQHRYSGPAGFSRISRTLPSTSNVTSYSRGAGSVGTTYHHNKTDGVTSENDLSKGFREMTLASSCTVDTFTRETPLVRQRPRTRPYVPPPRSVIIRSGYLPEVQTVNFIPSRRDWTSATATHQSSSNKEEAETQQQNADVAAVPTATSNNTPRRSQSECFTSSIPVKDRVKSEDLQLLSSSAPSTSKHLLEERTKQVVTNKEDHTEKVLKKDAGVNTSAEVLVLPKGTKTSVLLKTALADEVDGKEKRSMQRRRRKKRGIRRRVARVFGRIMIRFVELF